jgi:hypothetical protein
VVAALLDEARNRGAGSNDAELIDAALAALLDGYRRTELDSAYWGAYQEHPIGETDEGETSRRFAMRHPPHERSAATR